MFNKIYQKQIDLGEGRIATLETGKLARQADGAVVLRYENCMLLATVVSNKEAKEDIDFLPLSVDYQEKFAATGKIPGSFHRRESKLSDYEVLISRLVDRALRPLFPENYHADTQVNIQLISGDKEVMPDALAALAASAAISVSDIPFNGPISEVRVARIGGVFKVNPSITALADADIDLIVAGTKKNIIMVEGESKECSEQELAEAIFVAHDQIKLHCEAQEEMMADLSIVKRSYNHENNDEALRSEITAFTYDKVYAIAKSGTSKQERSEGFAQVLAAFLETKTEEERAAMSGFLVNKYFSDVKWEAMRNMILDEKIRLDGRSLTQVRDIACEVNFLPSAHGSALFTRGETQSLTSVTLGGKLDEQLIDGAMFDGTEKFLLHYNFPGFSTGEVRPNRGPGRREVGHGNLAHRSLRQVMPDQETCPYTIRIVSDILESNGSSSMATVCAGSLALMDAGVPIKASVSGIAMGLITDGKGRFAVLSDILGDEDHLGDMDFKVTGTSKGICGCQMDLKIDGLPREVLIQALEQAKAGRAHILNIMDATINKANDDYKAHTPRIVGLKIDKEFIGLVIGPGGKHIQELQRNTNTTINIEEVGNYGLVQIYSNDKEGMEAARNKIVGMTTKPEVGTVYDGKVVSIQAFGAFVEILPGKDGLLHISEISWDRLNSMDGVMKEGDIVKVKLIEVDAKTGKLRLSAKALLPKPEGYVERPSAPRPDRDRGPRNDRDGRDRGDRNDRGSRPPRTPRQD